MFQRRPESRTANALPQVVADPWDAHVEPAQAMDGVTGGGDATALLPWIDDVLAFGTSDAHHESASSKPTRTPAPKQVAEADKKLPPGVKFDPSWTSMALGTIQESSAPTSVMLPGRVSRGLDEAQRRMDKDGNREHGGNLVRTYGGEFDVRHGGNVGESGDPFSWSPNRKDVGWGQDFVGHYHTHSLEKGQTDDTFSGDDIANFANDDRRISMVRAGANTHMLARTKEFDAMQRKAEGASDDGLVERQNAFHAKMKQDYDKVFDTVYANDPKNRAAALEAATQAVAQQYHLLYYSGTGATLNRVGAPPKK